MSTAVTATPAIDTAIDRAFTDNRFVGAVVLIARDGKIVYRRAGGIGFAVSSEDDIEQERPVLSSIAHELESDSVVAVILRVEDPDRMARAAQDAGSGITRARELDPFTVVSDPFGGY